MSKPGYSMIKAAQIAQDFFYTDFPDGEKAAENDGLHVRDFILIKADYINRFEDKEFSEYAWVFTFVHPIHNDHSFTFKVTNDGKISFLSRTE
ncbi:MAG: hypothetical protein Q8N76_00895 [Candidatus Omnitrophota bacterium]|nr:hypothetical protein [Candidatus Omnitrophota bacterium]